MTERSVFWTMVAAIAGIALLITLESPVVGLVWWLALAVTLGWFVVRRLLP